MSKIGFWLFGSDSLSANLLVFIALSVFSIGFAIVASLCKHRHKKLHDDLFVTHKDDFIEVALTNVYPKDSGVFVILNKRRHKVYIDSAKNLNDSLTRLFASDNVITRAMNAGEKFYVRTIPTSGFGYKMNDLLSDAYACYVGDGRKVYDLTYGDEGAWG